MDVSNSEFIAEDGSANLLLIDELREMTDLLKKREDLVSLIIQGPYSKDGKNYINLKDFKFVAG